MSIVGRSVMYKPIDFIRQNRLVQILSSVKITVVCLGLLFILTFWGTIAQVENGLYIAQERYFFSAIFYIFNFLPFPGARLVLSVLFVNLCFAALNHFRYGWSHIGIIIIHAGLLLFFIAAFVTFQWSEDSQLTLMEGESSNISAAYHDWELSVWPQKQNEKEITAFATKRFKNGQVLDFGEFGFRLIVKTYYPNAEAYVVPRDTGKDIVINRSGISILKPISRNKEPEKNLPGGVFLLRTDTGKELNLLLYGGELEPTQFEINGQAYNFLLRRKRYVLPFVVRLLDFTKEVYPNTDVAKSYESMVEINNKGSTRDVRIYMNHPLRYKDYTFYQASYAVDAMGRELSTFAVVRNSGRLLPYAASLTTVFGLIVHFLLMAFRERKKTLKLTNA